MKIYKNLALSLFAIALLLLCLLTLPTTAQAASENDLTFKLNSSGDGYIVSDCKSSATGEMIIPATYNGLPVTGIGRYAFEDCDKLTSITIPEGVTSIEGYAFAWCYGLTNITIPDSVTSIGGHAFSSCDSLTYNTYGNCNYLGNEHNPYVALVRVTTKELQSCEIHPDTKIIVYGAFSGCTGLTYNTYGNCNYLGNENNPYVVLVSVMTNELQFCEIHPDTTIIGNDAFYKCTSLTSITIPDSVTSIGEYAFQYCGSLTSITIPDSVTDIGASAFSNCTSLTSITIPDSVTSIGDNVFSYCKSLTSITIPDSVTSIGNSAFSSCSSLASVTIPDSVTSIGSSAFAACIKLTSITIPNGVTQIGNQTFDNCQSLTSVTIPDGVTRIWDCAFRSCKSLTSVTIPDSVERIDLWAFRYCESLTSIIIPDSVTYIDEGAFQYCSGLTSATMGKGLIHIAYDAFYGCSKLESVTISDSKASFGLYALADSPVKRLIIADGAKNVTFKMIEAFGKAKEVIIPNSVSTISNSAFSNCSRLTEVIYCGTQAQWDAIEIGSNNEPLTNATLQFHDYENCICTICGSAISVTLSAPEEDIHWGDEVAVTVSVPAIEHCTTGGFLFDFDTDIFEYVRGEALVSGFSAAGVSVINGNIAGYFMSGEEDIQGDIFRIILRVKDNAPFADYTISGEASFSVQNSSEKVPNVVIGTTVTVTCGHSYGDWTPIDETWKKRVCTICSHEETDYIAYTVTFQYADGTVITSVAYHYGDTVAVPQPIAQVPNSVFLGWNQEIVACTGDAVYTAVFEVYVPGDMNGDENLTYHDAVYLLLYTMFGEERYPLSHAPSDFDGNGLVNDDDAVYLLLHVFYGEENYPLKKA